jgi:CGA synthase-related protein
MDIRGTARHSVLVAARHDDLDSVLALRRICAHLGELDLVAAAQWRNGLAGERAPCVALVCDDADAAAQATDMGLPVVFVHSQHRLERPRVEAPVVCLHSPGWIAGPTTAPPAVHRVGTLAPVRLHQARNPSAVLVLLAFADAAPATVVEFCADLVRPMLAKINVGPHRCTVVGDAHAGLASAELPGANVAVAADVDVDALHAQAGLFAAAPTLAACSLAQARRSSLVFLPPVTSGQQDLLDRVLATIPVSVLGEQGSGDLTASRPDWSQIDPAMDDLRGAQRIARKVRQLVLAPL